MEAAEFLDGYLTKGFGGEYPLIAANVLVPSMSERGTPKSSNVYKDYPELPEVGIPYRTIGIFGRGRYVPTDEGYDPPGFTSRGRIRGVQMRFVPGGVPAASDFNYEASKQKYPEYMRDIKPGYMPVYYDVADPRAKGYVPLYRPSSSSNPSNPSSPSIPSGPGNSESSSVLDRILNTPLPAPRPSTPSNPFAGENSNPFAGESQEYQDMMRRLGVIK